MSRRRASGASGLLVLTLLLPAAVAEPEPLGSPAGLHSIPHADGSITVAWSAPGSDGGSPIAYYVVERLGPLGWEVIGATTEEQLVDTGWAIIGTVVAGYRVSVVNEAGDTAWADSLSLIKIVGIIPPGQDGCWILESQISPPAAFVNVTCATSYVTNLLPDPIRSVVYQELEAFMEETNRIAAERVPLAAVSVG